MKEKMKYLIVGILALGVAAFIVFSANSALYKAKEELHARAEEQHESFIKISEGYDSSYGNEIFYYDVNTKIIWVELYGVKGRSFSPYCVLSESS